MDRDSTAGGVVIEERPLRPASYSPPVPTSGKHNRCSVNSHRCSPCRATTFGLEASTCFKTLVPPRGDPTMKATRSSLDSHDAMNARSPGH